MGNQKDKQNEEQGQVISALLTIIEIKDETLSIFLQWAEITTRDLKELSVLKDVKVSKVSSAFERGKAHLLKEDGCPRGGGLFCL